MTLAPLGKRDPRLARPLYTIHDAARFLDMPVSTLHTWIKPSWGDPLVTTATARGIRASIPFIGFAEAFVIQAAIKAGVPRRRIRPGVEAIRDQAGGIAHALASELVFTDGAEILLRVLDDHDLEVARTSQRQLRDAVQSQLRCIRFADDGYAARLELPQFVGLKVTVDPNVASGQPLLRVAGGIRIKDILDRVGAGDRERTVAADFGVDLAAIQEITRHARAA